jgi:hypothetical protein
MSDAPDSDGYIVAYDGRKEGPFKARFWGENLRRYLVEARGLEGSRLRVLDAGRHAGEQFKIELWLVPQGSDPPPTRPFREKRGASAFAGKFAEYFAYNSSHFYDTEGGEAGAYNTTFTLAALGELFRRQPDSQGFVVVYPSRDGDPGDWRRVATREQQKLAEAGVAGERLTLIRGGVNEGDRKGFQGEEEDRREAFGRIELWVGEKERPPVRHRAEKGTLKEAVLVAGVEGFWKDAEKIRKWALDNLFEALLASERSTACIVVFPDEPAGADADSEVRPERRIDLFQVAESLKAELRKRGIDETRIVLMHGPMRDSSGELEFWAVPYGAELPNPFAEAEGEAEPEESEPEGTNRGR